MGFQVRIAFFRLMTMIGLDAQNFIFFTVSRKKKEIIYGLTGFLSFILYNIHLRWKIVTARRHCCTLHMRHIIYLLNYFLI